MVSFTTKSKKSYASPSLSSKTTCCSPSRPKLAALWRGKGLCSALFLYARVPRGSSLSLLLLGRYHPPLALSRLITPQWSTRFPEWLLTTLTTLVPRASAPGEVTATVTQYAPCSSRFLRSTWIRLSPGPSVTSTASLGAPPWIPRGSSRFGELLKSLLKARDLKVEGLVVLCTACRGVTPPQPPPTERGAAGLPGPTLKPLLCNICRRRRPRRRRHLENVFILHPLQRR
mmetsp:Transcript_9102/g.31342  ORF Transcript_9102/g.31342 Transcript_9102/m.31342 type:complete len:230 (+) Transcript_9102:6152-6841(+)